MKQECLKSLDAEKFFSTMRSISQLKRIINGYFGLNLNSFAYQSLKTLDYELQKLFKLTGGCLNISYKVVDVFSDQGKKKTKEIYLYVV